MRRDGFKRTQRRATSGSPPMHRMSCGRRLPLCVAWAKWRYSISGRRRSTETSSGACWRKEHDSPQRWMHYFQCREPTRDGLRCMHRPFMQSTWSVKWWVSSNRSPKRRGKELRSKATENLSIQADRLLIHHALANILENAIKYAPMGTSIRVVIQHVASFVEVAVHDQGTAIDESLRLKVFDRFFRVDSSRSRDAGGMASDSPLQNGPWRPTRNHCANARESKRKCLYHPTAYVCAGINMSDGRCAKIEDY
jgi:hypothetical protein